MTLTRTIRRREKRRRQKRRAAEALARWERMTPEQRRIQKMLIQAEVEYLMPILRDQLKVVSIINRQYDQKF
jgi:hypothetical protein